MKTQTKGQLCKCRHTRRKHNTKCFMEGCNCKRFEYLNIRTSIKPDLFELGKSEQKKEEIKFLKKLLDGYVSKHFRITEAFYCIDMLNKRISQLGETE